MAARPSGAPWLLIEMCVLVAVYGSVGGVSSGPLDRARARSSSLLKEEEMDEPVAQGWAGIDVGKGHHWVCLIDETGSTLWSSKVVNDEAAILDAIVDRSRCVMRER